jgi:transcription antitermination factor NusG
MIGKYISDLINDGDCIQLGIGGIPNAVAKSLYGKKDLGVHTEMLTNEMAKLAKAGVITGKRKQLFPGKMVATFAMGNRDLYNFIDNNPAVMLLAGSYGKAIPPSVPKTARMAARSSPYIQRPMSAIRKPESAKKSRRSSVS